MHGLNAEFRHKPQREQVEVAVNETVETEFGGAVFASLVMNHLLAYLLKSRILCQIRHIAVHIAVYLDVLHHLVAIGFQAAVEVVQIVYAAHLAGGGIEEFGGNCLRQRVVALLFPPRHQVVAVLGNHTIQFGYFVRTVLQVCIHGYHHIALHALEAGVERRTLAVVASEAHSLHCRILGTELLYHFPRIVGAAVVDKQHFITEVILRHYAFYPCCQLR